MCSILSTVVVRFRSRGRDDAAAPVLWDEAIMPTTGMSMLGKMSVGDYAQSQVHHDDNEDGHHYKCVGPP
jgi:hypothetical protein